MAHETPDEFSFLKQVHSILKKSGKFLLTEPKMHVTFTEFKKTLSLAQKLGLITLKKVLLRSSGFGPRKPQKIDQKKLIEN
jgi:hypothetical protein